MRKLVLLGLISISTVFFTACGETKPLTPKEKFEACINNIQTIDMKTTPESGDTIATLKTNKGDIKMLLYTEKAPNTTQNFIELAKSGKYNDMIFHRVIKDFMIQTGDFERGDGTGGYSFKGPGTTVEDEFGEGLVHKKGAVSMANTGQPNSGGSQFFIVQAADGTHWLDCKHAIFGFVYDGLDIVDTIGNMQTAPGDKPLDDVIVETVEISTF